MKKTATINVSNKREVTYNIEGLTTQQLEILKFVLHLTIAISEHNPNREEHYLGGKVENFSKELLEALDKPIL